MIGGPPSVFEPLSDWERHLDELQDLLKEYPGNADVIDAIAEVEAVISEMD